MKARILLATTALTLAATMFAGPSEAGGLLSAESELSGDDHRCRAVAHHMARDAALEDAGQPAEPGQRGEVRSSN